MSAQQTINEPTMPTLDLPEPRVWGIKDLADFLHVSHGWIYARTGPSAEDRIPSIAGVGRLRFDTRSPKFQDWMRRQLGYVDTGETDEG